MTTPDTLTPATAAAVLARYPGLAGSLADFAPLPSGLYNCNARLTAGGRDLILKRLPAGAAPERIGFALSLQAGLAAAGFPCPGVLPNSDGDLVTACEGLTWTLQDLAGGSHLPRPDRSAYLDGGGARNLGEIVGRLHRLAGDLARTGRLAPAGDIADLPRLLDGTLRSARDFLAGGLKPSAALRLRLKPGKTVLEQEICRWTPGLKEAVAALATWRPPAHLDASGPGHGDINWENLLFEGNGRVTVLDFDNAGLMPLAWDAAAACAVVCGAGESRQAAFAAGYDAAGGPAFPSDDLPWLMVLKYVRSLAWQIRSRADAGNADLARAWVAFLGENLERTRSRLPV